MALIWVSLTHEPPITIDRLRYKYQWVFNEDAMSSHTPATEQCLGNSRSHRESATSNTQDSHSSTDTFEHRRAKARRDTSDRNENEKASGRGGRSKTVTRSAQDTFGSVSVLRSDETGINLLPPQGWRPDPREKWLCERCFSLRGRRNFITHWDRVTERSPAWREFLEQWCSRYARDLASYLFCHELWKTYCPWAIFVGRVLGCLEINSDLDRI